MDTALAALPRSEILLRPWDIVGIEALRSLVSTEGNEQSGVDPRQADETDLADLPPLGAIVDDLEKPGKGLIMLMGKGGVGKTTMASAIAIELAARGHKVHLTTTDPAAHLHQTLGKTATDFTVSRIDPAVETARYAEHIMETTGKDLGPEGRAVLEEDLRSPCTEEIAVFQAFSRIIRESSRHFVVVDTAPTGHTLMLLDATGAYHREAIRRIHDDSGKIETPMMRIQDPKRTKILIVTLPEATPVLEATRLQDDLRRAGIEPWAWII